MKFKLLFYFVLAGVFMTSANAFSKEKKSVEPFDRGIGGFNSCFIPQGTVGAGITFAYNTYGIGNGMDDSGFKALFSMIQNVHGNVSNFTLSPFVSYFVKDNLSVGVRFDYGRSFVNLDDVSLNLLDDMNIALKDYRYMKQSYSGAATLRNYMPFANSKRFAMFSEVRLSGGYAQAKNFKVVDGRNVGTYQDIYKCEVGIVPGLAAFITNEVAFEISVGLLGFDYQKVKQVTNQVEYSEMTKSGANFKVNLFAISFGLSFYIQTGDHRVKKNKTK